MNKTTTPAEQAETRLADYTPPVFLVDDVELDFDIGDARTRVASRLAVRRNPESAAKDAPLVLDGQGVELLGVTVDGKKLSPGDYALTGQALTIHAVPQRAVVAIECANDPAANTALSGLYAAGPMLCTQCESEGFRRITFFPEIGRASCRERV